MIRKKYFVVSLALLAITLTLSQIKIERPHFNWQLSTSDNSTVSSAKESSEVLVYASRYDDLDEAPAYFQDTDVDFDYQLDEDNKLLPNVGLKQMFEYFFTALGDESIETISIRVANFLTTTLPELQAKQGWDYFNRYLAYRDKLREMPQLSEQESLRERFDTLRSFQEAELGREMYEGFFANGYEYDHFILDRQDILDNDHIYASEKEHLIIALEESLPDSFKGMRKKYRALQQSNWAIDTSDNSLTDSDGPLVDESKTYLVREQLFGAEVALKLQESDRQRSEWNQRYQDYKQKIDVIERSSLSQHTKDEEKAFVLNESFHPNEFRRVQTLDRLGDLVDS